MKFICNECGKIKTSKEIIIELIGEYRLFQFTCIKCYKKSQNHYIVNSMGKRV